MAKQRSGDTFELQQRMLFHTPLNAQPASFLLLHFLPTLTGWRNHAAASHPQAADHPLATNPKVERRWGGPRNVRVAPLRSTRVLNSASVHVGPTHSSSTTRLLSSARRRSCALAIAYKPGISCIYAHAPPHHLQIETIGCFHLSS